MTENDRNYDYDDYMKMDFMTMTTELSRITKAFRSDDARADRLRIHNVPVAESTEEPKPKTIVLDRTLLPDTKLVRKYFGSEIQKSFSLTSCKKLIRLIKLLGFNDELEESHKSGNVDAVVILNTQDDSIGWKEGRLFQLGDVDYWGNDKNHILKIEILVNDGGFAILNRGRSIHPDRNDVDLLAPVVDLLDQVFTVIFEKTKKRIGSFFAIIGPDTLGSGSVVTLGLKQNIVATLFQRAEIRSHCDGYFHLIDFEPQYELHSMWNRKYPKLQRTVQVRKAETDHPTNDSKQAEGKTNKEPTKDTVTTSQDEEPFSINDPIKIKKAMKALGLWDEIFPSR